MMKKMSYVIAALALTAIMSAGMGKAWAYFTTYARAEGGYPIDLGDKTEIREEFSRWTKHVTISNEEGSQPVYIRVKAFCGSQYHLVYSGAGWTSEPDGEGYYYYGEPVSGGAATGALDIVIDQIPENPEDGDQFNVIVIYESTPVLYDSAGNPYADWDALQDSGSEEYSGEEGGGAS